tara:strand:- start:24 stop:194 length:171 start_codon:yes stop_codon:yes gene_type:complete
MGFFCVWAASATTYKRQHPLDLHECPARSKAEKTQKFVRNMVPKKLLGRINTIFAG